MSDGGEISTNMVGKLGGILNIKEISEEDNKRLCRHLAISMTQKETGVRSSNTREY